MDWYPWYFQIYEADTMHLTPHQDGCYRRLIDHYMKTRSPLPDNDSALARISGISTDEWLESCAAVKAFFKPKDGLLFLDRCETILSDQDARTRRLSESGKKGAKKRASQDIENKQTSSHPEATLKPPLSQRSAQDKTRQDKEERIEGAVAPPPSKVLKISSRGTRIPLDWVLPLEWGEWAMKEGLARQQVLAEEESFRDYWVAKSGKDATKNDWQATWRNWVRRSKEFKRG